MKIEFAYSFIMISICPLQALAFRGLSGSLFGVLCVCGVSPGALLFFEFVELMGIVIPNPFTEVIFTKLFKMKLCYNP